jgi:hypothetical protein
MCSAIQKRFWGTILTKKYSQNPDDPALRGIAHFSIYMKNVPKPLDLHFNR